MTRALGSLVAVALVPCLLLTALPTLPADAPALEAPAAVKAAQVVVAAMDPYVPWVTEGTNEYHVYADCATAAEVIELAGDIPVTMRADKHMIEKHGKTTRKFMKEKPMVEVWHRATPGDEALCLIFADMNSGMALGLFLGARGEGSLSGEFTLDMLANRLALTGWIMTLARWHAKLPMQGYVCVWPAGGAVAG